jgi:hypothetical protein
MASAAAADGVAVAISRTPASSVAASKQLTDASRTRQATPPEDAVPGGVAVTRDTLAMPFGPSRHRKGNRMTFTYKLEQKDGTPADPPTVRTAAPTRPGDTIPLGRDKTLRVIDTRPGSEPDDDWVLVVEAA